MLFLHLQLVPGLLCSSCTCSWCLFFYALLALAAGAWFVMLFLHLQLVPGFLCSSYTCNWCLIFMLSACARSPTDSGASPCFPAGLDESALHLSSDLPFTCLSSPFSSTCIILPVSFSPVLSLISIPKFVSIEGLFWTGILHSSHFDEAYPILKLILIGPAFCIEHATKESLQLLHCEACVF